MKTFIGIDVGYEGSYGAMTVMRKRPDGSLEVVASGVFNPDKPRCARCNKPVEKLTEYLDQATGKTILIAVCHGRSERVVLDDELLMELYGNIEIRFTDAFRGGL